MSPAGSCHYTGGAGHSLGKISILGLSNCPLSALVALPSFSLTQTHSPTLQFVLQGSCVCTGRGSRAVRATDNADSGGLDQVSGGIPSGGLGHDGGSSGRPRLAPRHLPPLGPPRHLQGCALASFFPSPCLSLPAIQRTLPRLRHCFLRSQP